MMYKKQSQSGFSLIEMLVSLAIFGIVLVTATAAVLRIVDANRKTQSLKSVVNNLNFVFERMSREIRTGTNYHCDVNDTVDLGIPRSCSTTGSSEAMAFEAAGGDPDTESDQIIYRCVFPESADGNIFIEEEEGEDAEDPFTPHGFIARSDDGGATYSELTSTAIDIKKCRFTIDGASPGDGIAPSVMISIYGVSGDTERDRTEFVVQTSLTQRVLEGN